MYFIHAYSCSIHIYTGKVMDAIVVDTKQTASDCIRYLKDQRIGTCTILPLDNLKSKSVPRLDKIHICINNHHYYVCFQRNIKHHFNHLQYIYNVYYNIFSRLRALGGSYRLCQDLVECNETFLPAISYAIGNTIVCETLEDARELCFNRDERLKVVTLNGHKISKSGAMTGGESNGRGSGDRFEEKEAERLKKRKTELEEVRLINI